ncbi:hypothetical protein MXAZACID_14909 [Acidocella sp. MX-AZ02]|nr:hypothetical protein MXAZACID_14909 [Acidocella sp. MX-AZ02]
MIMRFICRGLKTGEQVDARGRRSQLSPADRRAAIDMQDLAGDNVGFAGKRERDGGDLIRFILTHLHALAFLGLL